MCTQPIRRQIRPGCALAMLLTSLLALNAVATEWSPTQQTHRQWTFDQLFQQGTSRGIIQTPEGLTLDDRLLVEDDAPACGYSTIEGSDEILKEGVVLRKALLIDRWPVKGAVITMMVYPLEPKEPNNGRHLLFKVNNQPEISYEVNHFWTQAPVPAQYLKKGKNVIEVRVQEPDTQFKTFVALDQYYKVGSTTRLHHPNRSARSIDGGRHWSDKKLGTKGIVDGEYSIRLKLEAYQPEGWLESPVIDMAAGPEPGPIVQPAEILQARLNLELAHNTGHLNTRSGLNPACQVSVRTGDRGVAQAGRWSPWTALNDDLFPAKLIKNRYLQFRIEFKSKSGLATPVLKKVVLNADSCAKNAEALSGLRVLSAEIHPVTQCSLEFQHEDPANDRLRQLRRQYKLDDVVAGSRTEFEKLLKLKSWVASQWEWFLPGPAFGDLTEWDALKILSPNKEGKTGGYCLHYAIVFAQVCQSFGIPARVINANYSIWGGHEMNEVWSNDYGKWVLMDANFDTCFFDPQTGVPLNALELHRIFTQTYYKGEVIDRDHWSRSDMVARAERVGRNPRIAALIGGGAKSGKLCNYEWWKPVVEITTYCGGYGPINLAELRWLPRSNFLSQPMPMPLNHGRSHWGWTGYYCWYDEQTPRTPEHAIFTNRAGDLYPVLNGVDFTAEAVASGRLAIRMATQSPTFDHYQLAVNGKDLSLKTDEYAWELAPGDNRIQMRVVDTMGNQGPISHLDLTYIPLSK